MEFEICELDCYMYDEEWTVNTSYYYGIMRTTAKDEKRAFAHYLKQKHGITFKRNRTRIEFDGDFYTITDRKTHEPLFVAIPHY